MRLRFFPPRKKIEDAFNFWMLPWQLSSWTSEVQFAACSKSVSSCGILNRQGGMKSSVQWIVYPGKSFVHGLRHRHGDVSGPLDIGNRLWTPV